MSITITYSTSQYEEPPTVITINLLDVLLFLPSALFRLVLLCGRSLLAGIKSALSHVLSAHPPPSHSSIALPPRIDPIPVEIYHHILSNLAGNELVACLRASKTFHNITAPIAYPLLYSALSIDLEKSVTPLSVHGVPIALGMGTGKSYEDWECQQKELAKSPHYLSQPFTRPDRFAFVTFLTLKAHTRDAHLETPLPIIMPHLDTLRIPPAHPHCYLDLCEEDADASEGPCCPLLTHLSPRKLILGGTMTHLIGSLNGLWQPFPPPFIKELVILVGMFADKHSIRQMEESFFNWLPSTVDKLSFVLSSAEEGWRVFQKDDMEPDTLLDLRDVDGMTLNVALACLGLAKVVEIVGIRGAASYRAYGAAMHPDEEDKRYQRCIRRIVKMRLLGKGWEKGEEGEEEDAAARAEAIKFADESDFMAENSWYENPEGRWSAEAVMDYFKPGMRDGSAM